MALFFSKRNTNAADCLAQPDNGGRQDNGGQAEERAPEPEKGRRILLLAFGSTICMVMGVNTVMPMVPMLARTFNVSQTSASLLITCFTLPGILFTLPAGILADRYGRRAVLVPALALFALAGAGCAFAPDFGTLLALRFLQGVGAAPLGVLNTTIIADAWSGRSLARLIGYNMTVLSVCTAAYPSLSGLLAHFDWRWPFLLSLLALPMAGLAARTPLGCPGTSGSFRQYLHNMLHTFENREILTLLGLTVLTFLLLYGPIITCFPVLADNRFAASPAVIGACLIFSSLGTGLAASQLGRLTARFGSRALFLAAAPLYVAALLLIPIMPTIWMLLPPIFLYGLAQGLNVPNVQTRLLQAAPPERRAVVMSMNGMLLRLGQTLGPVGFSVVMAHAGVPAGFYAGMVLVLLLFVLTLLWLRDPA